MSIVFVGLCAFHNGPINNELLLIFLEVPNVVERVVLLHISCY